MTQPTETIAMAVASLKIAAQQGPLPSGGSAVRLMHAKHDVTGAEEWLLCLVKESELTGDGEHVICKTLPIAILREPGSLMADFTPTGAVCEVETHMLPEGTLPDGPVMTDKDGLAKVLALLKKRGAAVDPRAN